MTQFNCYERMHIEIPGWEIYSDQSLVRVVSPDVDGSFIAYFKSDASHASDVVEQQMDYFYRLGKNFEWKVYDFDEPSNMEQILLDKGFYQQEEESFMVLDLNAYEVLPELQEQCIEVFDACGIRDAIEVKRIQTGEDFSAYYLHLLNLKQTRPDNIRIYVIYDEGQPVSSAWMIFNNDHSPFAGIWGGSTVQSQRGRGHYQALLKQRIRDSILAGKKYLYIDASEMSRPIVERYGFKVISKTVPYFYRHPDY
uniref:GNAT family N-acetyltransferase n=2 Tax=Vibrio ziniensis TaxID=2711221 RepID=A0A6G7CMB9_9VIBR|nr:GNAT family N-acetyltransferase [Vibrio ziniensis]